MIDAYLVDPVIIMKSSDPAAWQEPGVYDEINVMGKIEYKTRLISDMKGVEVVAGT